MEQSHEEMTDSLMDELYAIIGVIGGKRGDSVPMDVAWAIKEVERMKVENATLRTRLHEQSLQAQATSQQTHDAVVKVLRDAGAIPEGIDPAAHPTEQVVATCVAQLHALWDAEVVRLQEEAAEDVRRDADTIATLHKVLGEACDDAEKAIQYPFKVPASISAARAFLAGEKPAEGDTKCTAE
jgi:hypothetical protein